MTFGNRSRNQDRLLTLGIVMLGLRGGAQMLLARSGPSSDLADLILGLFLGLGAGLIMLGLWRARARRDGADGRCPR